MNARYPENACLNVQKSGEVAKAGLLLPLEMFLLEKGRNVHFKKFNVLFNANKIIQDIGFLRNFQLVSNV